MLKRLTFAAAVASLVAIAFPQDALASRTIAGRITAYSTSSLSVADKEIVTFAIDARTSFTKLTTAKPWQADTSLDARALRVGRYAVIHPRDGEGGVASWIEIAIDVPLIGSGVRYPAGDDLFSTGEAYTSIAALVEVLPRSELSELVIHAKTTADHRRLASYFGALAVKHEAAAYEHLADARSYRRSPTAAESKRPGSPGTGAHCEQLAKADFEAAREASRRALEYESLAAAVR